jgi:hypothetical protein
MTLPNDLTPRQLGDLAMKMAVMDAADLIKLSMEHPGRVNAVALIAAVAVGSISDDDPPPAA